MAYGATVVGTVSLWGRVIEHRRGYRSEFAYPSRLRLVCSTCLDSGWWSYSAPETVVECSGNLVAFCVDHMPDDDDTSVPARGLQDEVLANYGVELLPILQPEGAGRVLYRIRAALRRLTRGVPGWAVIVLILVLRTVLVLLWWP